MKTIKAGCFLIDKENKMIALIHREKQDDYSFPKGHVEQGEDIKSAAIRETAEETKRDAIIVDKFAPFVEKYVSSRGEDCECHMFIALDNGLSKNDSEDTHELCWTKFEKVEERLSYESLKTTWRAVKQNIEALLNK